MPAPTRATTTSHFFEIMGVCRRAGAMESRVYRVVGGYTAAGEGSTAWLGPGSRSRCCPGRDPSGDPCDKEGMRSEVVPDLGVGLCAPVARSPRRRAAWIVTLVIGALACGGTAHQVAIGPVPAKETHAVLAGPLCGDNRCKCRDDSVRGDGGAGTPDGASKKRFEIRLGPSPYELW